MGFFGEHDEALVNDGGLGTTAAPAAAERAGGSEAAAAREREQRFAFDIGGKALTAAI